MSDHILDFEKLIFESSDGHTYLSVHARLIGTSLYTVARRDVLDVPVRILDAIEDQDWSDPLLQELRREALDDIECQAHVIARAFVISAMEGGDPTMVWTQTPFDASQAAYWINAGYDDYMKKGLDDPSDDHGRYGKDELILARAGFTLAKHGFPRIENPE